jgi:hypothetical protein
MTVKNSLLPLEEGNLEHYEVEEAKLRLETYYRRDEDLWVACLGDEDVLLFGYGQSRETALEDLQRTLAELPVLHQGVLEEGVPSPFWEWLLAGCLRHALKDERLREEYSLYGSESDEEARS